jgi:hypothetical protein
MPEVTYNFIGMNNVIDPSDIAPDPSSRELTFKEAALLVNVDPDNDGCISMRQGFVSSLRATGLHSGWSNPYDPKEGYFVNDTLLNRINADGTITIVRFDMIPGIPVNFCQINDVVAYSNGLQFGIIEDGLDTPSFTPTAPYKARMVAGKHMEFFNGRLYALVDNYQGKPCSLVCSDALDVAGWLESMDLRENIVENFDGEGSMVARVDGGLFVSSSIETFFLEGSDAVTSQLETYKHNGFVQSTVAPYPAIPGTVLPIKSDLLNVNGLPPGNALLWASTRGVCVGGTGGFFKNLTESKVSYPVGTKGTAVLREYGGLIHYVFAIQGGGDAYNVYEAAL